MIFLYVFCDHCVDLFVFQEGFREDEEGWAIYCCAVVHGAATYLPDFLEYLGEVHGSMIIKHGIIGRCIYGLTKISLAPLFNDASLANSIVLNVKLLLYSTIFVFNISVYFLALQVIHVI